MNRALLRDELRRDEALRLTAYRDSLGNWTIGYGHLLGATPRMTVITAREADALFESDIDIAIAGAVTVFPDLYTLSPGRERVLCNMAFNLGVNRLAGFKRFLAALRERDWPRAAREMVDSLWWHQVGARGPRLRDLMLAG